MVYSFIGLYGIVRYKILQKQDARQRECAAESRVEKRDEWVGKYTRSAQTDSAAHHHRHDDVCLQVKETPERLTLLLVAENSLCVLLTHSEKHRAEQQENHNGQRVPIPLLLDRKIGEDPLPRARRCPLSAAVLFFSP